MRKVKLFVCCLLLILISLSITLVSAESSSDSEITGVSDDVIKIDSTNDSMVIQSQNTQNQSVDRIIASSANENNSLNNPQENISQNSYKSLIACEDNLNSNLDESKLGMTNTFSILRVSDDEILSSGYESDVTYEHNYNSALSMGTNIENYLSHFRDVTEGVLSGSGKKAMNIFWTPVEDGVMYIFVEKKDTSTDVKSPDAPKGFTYESYETSDPYNDVTVIKISGIVVTSPDDAEITIVRTGGSNIEVTGMKLYYTTTTSISLSKVVADISDNVVITPTVTLYDGTIVTEGTVNYYCDSILIGTSAAGSSFIFNPSGKSIAKGSHKIYAVYQENSNLHYFTSTSDKLDLEVKQLIKTSLSITVNNVEYPNKPVASVTTNAPGTYNVIINGKSYSLTFTSAGTKTVTHTENINAGNNYAASVSFSGNNDYSSANAQTTFSVSKSSDVGFTTTIVNGNWDSSNSYWDVNYTHSFTIISSSSKGNIGGNVVYVIKDGSTTLDTITKKLGETLTYTVTSIPSSSRNLIVTATYQGSTNYNSGASDSEKIHISRHNTYSTIEVNQSNIKPGDYVKITPHVYIANDGDSECSSGNVELTTGTVYIYKSGSSTHIGSVTAGEYLEYQINDVGDYTFYSVYQKNEYYRASTSSVSDVVKSIASTSFTLTANGKTGTIYVNAGENINFAWALTPNDATGSINIYYQGSLTNTMSQNSGSYSYSLPAGRHVVYLEFEASGNYKSSTSNTLTLEVLDTTSTELGIDKTSIDIGGSIVLTPIVKNGNSQVTSGIVKIFLSDGTMLGLIDLSKSSTFTYTPNKVNNYSFYAVYEQNITNHLNGSKSAKIDVEVKKITTDLKISVSNVTYLENTEVTITTNAPGNYTYNIGGVSGTIEFKSSGSKKFNLTLQGQINSTASVSFADNVNYTNANVETKFSVYPRTSVVTINGNNLNLYVGDSITLTGHVNDDLGNEIQTGNVYWVVNGENKGIVPLNSYLTLNDLKAGEYVISLYYQSANNNYKSASSSEYVINVSKYTIKLSLDVSNGKYALRNTTVTITTDTPGNYSYNIGGVNGIIEFKQPGSQNFNISLAAGDNYNASVNFTETDKYYSVNKNTTFNVEKCDIWYFSISDKTLLYDTSSYWSITILGGSGQYTYRLYDENGEYNSYIEDKTPRVTAISLNLLKGLNVGEYTLNITSVSNENYTGGSKTAKLTINPQNSDITLQNQNANWGDDVEQKITYTYASDIAVELLDSNNKSVEGKLTKTGNIIKLSNLDAGNYRLKVTTITDANSYSVTKYANITVSKIPSELSFDDIKYTYGESGSVTVTLKGATGISEAIILKDGIKVADAEVNGNIISVSGLAAGNYTLNITTNPDANHTAITKSGKITVNKAQPHIMLNETELTIIVGNSITFHNTVTPNFEGNVILYINGSENEQYVFNCDISRFFTKEGIYKLYVKYAGNENYTDATSNNITVNVVKTDALFDVTKNATIYYNDSIIISSSILPDEAYGDVTYTFDDATMSAVTIKTGESFIYSPKTLGSHIITATYKGTEKYNSQVKTIKIEVIKRQTVTLLEINSTEINLGSLISIRPIVKDGEKIISGKVLVNINGTVIEAQSNVWFTYEFENVGSANINATYVSTTYYKESNSVIYGVLVNKMPVNLIVTISNANYDSDIIINALIEGHDDAKGNVTVTIDGIDYNVVINNGVGYKVISRLLNVSTYSFNASYSGDMKYSNDTCEGSFEILQITPGFNATSDKSLINYEGNVKLNTSVENNKATGNVTYIVDGNIIGVLNIGEILTFTPASAGNHTVVIRYSGDNNFKSSEKNITIKVEKTTTAGFDAYANQSNISFESSIKFISSLANANATGTVTYYIDGTLIERNIVIGEYLYTPLSAGNHTIKAVYSGDKNFNGSEVEFNITVDKINSGFNATADKYEIIYLNNVILDSTVVNVKASAGKVTFYFDDGTNKTVNIGDKVTYTPNRAGNHTVKAFYHGDHNFNNQTVNILIKVLKSSNHGFYVQVTPRVLDYLQNTTLKGTLSNGAIGKVTYVFDDGTKNITVDIGEEYVYVPKWAGNHYITAIYSGDDNFTNNTRTINITVRQIDPNFHIRAEEGINEITFGQSIVIRTIVDEKYTDLVTGNVTIFFSNGTNKTVKIGESIIYTPYKAGLRIINATYYGDRNFILKKDSGSITVKKSDDSGFYVNATPFEIDFKDSTLILGNVTNSNAKGNVTYRLPNGTNITKSVGVAIEFIPNSTGIFHVIVDYDGDENFNPMKTKDVTIKVNSINSGFNASSDRTNITFEESIVLNSSVLDALAVNGIVTYSFDDDTSSIVAKVGEIVSYTPRSAGNHTIAIKYHDGKGNFVDAIKTIVVNVARSDNLGFNAYANPNLIDYLQSTEIISTVTNPKATGSVTYKFDDGTTQVIRLSDWNIHYTPLSAGIHNVTVIYSGDTNFNGVEQVVQINVSKIESGLSAFTIRTNVTYLNNIIIYHEFSHSDVSGNITYIFSNGGKITLNVSENAVYLPYSAGEQTVKVIYNGDNNYKNATFDVTFKILKSNQHSFYVEVNPREFEYLKNTTLKGTLRNGATGNVTFIFDDGTESVTVKIGEEYVYVPKWAGKHSVKAIYNGDGNFTENTRIINLTVDKLDSNFQIRAENNRNEITFGESVVIRTLVDDKYSSLVTGNVTFFFSNGTNKTVKIGESIVYTPYKAGERLVRAEYTGDVNFNNDTDKGTIIVNKASNSGFFANITPVIDFKGVAIVFGNVTNSQAGGNITYRLPNGTNITNSIGVPIEFMPDAADTFHIIVDYSGDENFKEDSKEVTVKVNPINSGFNVTSDKLDITFEDSVVLNSSVLDALAVNGIVTYSFDDGTSSITARVGEIVSYTPRSAGNHTIAIKYHDGEGNFVDAIKTIVVNVARSDNLGFNAYANPNLIDYLQSTEIISTVTNPKATGSVTYKFDDGTTQVIRLSDWNYVYTPLSAGIHNVTVIYSGDTNFNGVEQVIQVNVSRINPSFEIYTQRSSIVYLDNITIYHRINSQATGNVTYYFSDGTQETVNLSKIVSFKPDHAGKHVVNATYSGDKNYNSVKANVTFNVTKSNNCNFEIILNPNVIMFEQNTTINTRLSNGATGNVTIRFDDGTGEVKTIIGNLTTYTPLTAGIRSINVTYSGDNNFNGKSEIVYLTVNTKGAGLSISSNTTRISYENSVLLNTSVIDKLATGNVTLIFDDGTKNVTLKIGETYVYTPKSGGSHTVKVYYPGDENFDNETSSVTISVSKSSNSGFSATAIPNNIPFESSSIILGNVSNPNAKGNITYVFSNGEITFNIGQAYEFKPNSTGRFHITVKYSGDSNFEGDEKDLVVDVYSINSGFNVTSDKLNIAFEDSVVLNSSVLDALAVNGTVTYSFDDDTPDYVVSVGEIVSYTPRSAGNHTITIKYHDSEDNFVDAIKTIVVNVARSDNLGFNAYANPNLIDYLQSTEIISTVTNPKATGSVTYKFDDGTTQVIRLSDWNYVYTPLSAGIHNVTVIYSGDTNFNGVEQVIQVNVSRINPSFEIYTQRSSIVYLDNITIYHRINSQATGNVTYYFSDGTQETVNLSKIVSFKPDHAGKHVVNATYSGDKNYNSVKANVTFNVTQSDNSGFFVEVSRRDLNYLENTTLKGIFLNSNGATGYVTFIFDDGTESVTVPIGVKYVYRPNWAGNHNFTAIYNGDDNFNENIRTVNLTVNKISSGFHVNASSTNITYENSVIFSHIIANSNATGNVTYFFDDGSNVTVKLNETYTYTPKSAGSHFVKVEYSGDDNFIAVNESGHVEVMRSKNTLFDVSAEPDEISFEANTVITGFAKDNVTGNVTYYLPNGTNITRNIGTSIIFVPTSAGNYLIRVTYDGDGNYSNSEKTINVIVKKIDSGFNASSNLVNLVYQDSVKLNSSVTNLKATGNVTYIFDDGTSIEIKNIGEFVSYTPKSAGNHSIIVKYSGDVNFNNVTKVINITVSKSNTSGFNISAEPDVIPFEGFTVLNSSVVNGNATGNVTFFFDDGTSITCPVGTVVNYIPDSTGNHTVRAVYEGDDNFNGISKTITIQVKPIDAGFNATCNMTNIGYEGSIQLNCSVSDVFAGGNVTYIFDDGTNTVKNIGEVVSYTPKSAGNHSIIVKYSGDANFNNVTKVINITVSKSNTSGFNVSANPYVIPFEGFTVLNSSVVNYNATGNVTFIFDDGTNVTQSIGTSINYQPASAGNHTVRIVYEGDDNFNGTSKTITIQVNDIGADFKAFANTTNITYQQSIQLNSTVGDKLATGNVTYIFDDGTNVTVKNIGEIFIYTPKSAGNHTITAFYSGDENFNNATITINLKVSKSDAGFNASATSYIIPYEGSTILTSEVLNSNATGEVIYEIDNRITIPSSLNRPFEFHPSSTGNHTIKIHYTGDDNFNGVDKEIIIKVTSIDAGINIKTNTTHVTYKDSISINTTLNDSQATGNVTYIFSDGTKSITAKLGENINYTPKSYGNHTITVKYSGDSNFNNETSTINITVKKATIDVNVTIINATYPDTSKVIVNASVDGNYTVTVGGKMYNATVENGSAIVGIDQLPAGEYNITVNATINNYNDINITDKLTVSNGTIEMNVSISNPTFPDEAIVTVNSTVDGNFTVSVENNNYTIVVKNGTGNVTIGTLNPGNHNITVTSNITSYNVTSVTKNVTVSEGKIDMNVTVSNPSYPDKPVVEVKSTVDGNYTVNVGDNNYTIVVENGSGKIEIDQLSVGNYNVTVSGNISNYVNTSKTENLQITKGKLDYDVNITNPTYPNQAKVTITSDVDGEFIVEVNNKQYSVKVADGIGSITLDELSSGKYPVKVISNIANYDNVIKQSTVTVNPKISDKTVKVSLTIRNTDGKVLANKKVTFTYNGKTYTVKTNKKGVATITVKKTTSSTNAAVVLKKINGKKVSTKISKFKYSATFKNKKGKVISGKKVTFKFNGKTYVTKTNKNGVATITLKNIKVGTYKIVAKCNKIVHKATVKIKN